jgi:hypothetical protein
MIKLNDTSSANVSLVGEDELAQVVGGYCHRRRRHCGGWRRREYRGCGYGYGKDYGKDYGYEGEKYEGGEYDGGEYEGGDYESSGDVQIANVAVTVNIAQVQG